VHRVVQRQHVHRRREAHVLRLRGDVGEQQVGPRVHAQRVEVVLADPARVHADAVGEDRLLADLEHELVRAARVRRVVVVAQGEIAEFHALLTMDW